VFQVAEHDGPDAFTFRRSHGIGARGAIWGGLYSGLSVALARVTYPTPKKPKPPKMRSLLMDLPEDVLVALMASAKAEQLTVHELMAVIINDWLG